MMSHNDHFDVEVAVHLSTASSPKPAPKHKSAIKPEVKNHNKMKLIEKDGGKPSNQHGALGTKAAHSGWGTSSLPSGRKCNVGVGQAVADDERAYICWMV